MLLSEAKRAGLRMNDSSASKTSRDRVCLADDVSNNKSSCMPSLSATDNRAGG